MRTKERLYLRNAELNWNFGKYLLLHIQVVHHYPVVLAGWVGGGVGVGVSDVGLIIVEIKLSQPS